MIFISGTKEIWLENTAVAIGKFDGLHRGTSVSDPKNQQL